MTAGYSLVMNQALGRRRQLLSDVLAQYANLNDFLAEHSPEGVWLFQDFGRAEVVFAPLFMRFWFLERLRGVLAS